MVGIILGTVGGTAKSDEVYAGILEIAADLIDSPVGISHQENG